MGLKEAAGRWFAKRWIGRAREGKEGKEAQGVLKFLDGKKRYLMLIVFLAESIAGLTGHKDLAATIHSGLALLGWDAGDAVVSLALVGQFAAAGWAIADGVAKDRAKRRAAAETVTLPR